VKALRIGTRGSALALWQANHIRARLAELHGVESELVRIRTSGDHFQTGSVALVGTKGVFIKELEDALLAGTIDLAVHSMKDVPTEIPGGLAFPAITKREDPRDCLVSHSGVRLSDLPAGARVGTSSLRRQAQLRHHRPDLQLLDLRGNVDTRLKKVAAGEFDAIVLALAGVKRLGASEKVTEILATDMMLPAVGQGALGIETRTDDDETTKFIAALDDAETRACVTAERALLLELEGGCQVPLGALARLERDDLFLEACVFSPDGKDFVRREFRGSAREADSVGKHLGQILIDAGADKILRLAGRSVGQR
jgi:hydroxymethylbilane synthase